MNIAMEKKAEQTLLRVQEERLDAHNSSDLKAYILHQLENGAKRLILDLSGVRFIDSSGLGALLSGYKNAGLRQAGFVLTGLQPRVQSMFELTRLQRVFEIYATIDDALAATAEEPPHEPDRD
jgi:anti-sigma B factor antagonist